MTPVKCAGGGQAVLLLDTAHLHAEVARLDDHGDAPWLQRLLNAVPDLAGQPLLDLQAAGKHIHHPRDLDSSR